jgi:hypothetical protein
MAKKYMKKYSRFLSVKKMQIKTRLKLHLTPVRLATIKNIISNNVDKDVGKNKPQTLLVRM